MASIADKLREAGLADEAPKQSIAEKLSAIDDQPAAAAAVPSTPPSAAEEGPTEDLPWYKRAAMGFGDPIHGAAQIMNRVQVPRALAATLPFGIGNLAPNVARENIRRDLASIGADEAASLFGDVSPEDFDKLVARRESAYQAQRPDDAGLDLARVGGAVANPMSWLGGSGVGRTLFGAFKAGAQTGAFQALLQPVASEGNFIYNKGVQALIGAGAGGTLSAAVHKFTPLLGTGVRKIREAFAGADDATRLAAATQWTDEALKAAGADPAKMDRSLYSSIRREVAEALQSGADPDPAVIANRADAAALPVPVELTRGQATRDPMLYAWEHRVSGQRGAGEALSERIATQNRQLIENLNFLGAKKAPTQFEASTRLIQHLQSVDESLRDQVSQAYRAVRDSAGRPALMDSQAFIAQSKNLLTDGRPELANLASLADYLPEQVAKQYNDILGGKLPLTVDTAQFLDRAWGGVQRGAKDETAKKAIGALRTALNEVPVTDALGAESMQAYQAARSLAKQRFDLINSSPALKAVVDGIEPDKFFQKYVQGANVSELSALKKIIGPDNTQMLQHTMIDQLKRVALNRASDENGVFSQAAYNRILQDPVQAPRIAELFSDAPITLDHLYRIGRVAELRDKIPAASRVNTSNTASELSNIMRDVANTEAVESLWNLIPGARDIRGVAAQSRLRKAVSESLSPGVTARAIEQQGSPRLSDLAARGTAVGIGRPAVSEEE